MFVTPQLALRIDGRYRSAYISSNEATTRLQPRLLLLLWSNWYGSGEVTEA